MGNNSGIERSKAKMPVREKLPIIDLADAKVAKDSKLAKLKKKCKKLSKKTNVTTATKISIIKEAIPNLKLYYEPLKTYYSLDKVVMSSKFGAISMAYCKQDLDKEVLVKVVNLENVTSHLYLIIQELIFFSKMDHENIAKIKSILCDEDKIYLIMDCSGYMALSDFVLDREGIKETEAVDIIHQLLDVLEYLHSLNICHRDLRPESILINPDTLEIKLASFEFSKSFTEGVDLKTKLGSPHYMAPEILSRKYNKE